MKGDFTRTTFQPTKHYSSVRMQQGRLQLDADWNEQVDIQNYLHQTQAKDILGESGAVKDSFTLSLISNGEVLDLAIAPGHLYVSGTLCELETGTPFTATQHDGNKWQVATLIVDGRPLAPQQWVEVLDNQLQPILQNEQPLRLQILEISSQQELGFNQPVSGAYLRRIATFSSQPDYPNPNPGLMSDGMYWAYLDVWQRHITAIEDPNIREVALSIPDTTTRTQTVWQLKLLSVNNPENPDGDWQHYLNERKTRSALLTARAVNYQRPDNQLYRVEVHDGGEPGQVTFKWARDNASVLSKVKDIQDNTILLGTGSNGWQAAQPGQWLELTSDRQELSGKPGTLVRLQNASGSKLIFDKSQIVGDPLPTDLAQIQALKVRLWNDWKQTRKPPEGSAPIPLPLGEDGIEIQFDSGNYEPGDYWLIPARAATRDIAWATDNSKTPPQPLPQPPQGIHHEYAPLALLKPSEDGAFQLVDQRRVFPALDQCVNRFGDTMLGSLEIRDDLYITGKFNEQNEYVEGRIGVGRRFEGRTTQPLAALDLQPTMSAKASGEALIACRIDPQFSTGGQTNVQQYGLLVTSGNVGIGTPNPVSKLGILGNVAIGNNSYVTASTLPVNGLVVQGNVGIGTNDPKVALDVVGQTRINGRFQVGDKVLFTNAAGQVGIGTNIPDRPLDVAGNTRITGDTTILGKTDITGNTTVNGNATVTGISTLNGNTTVNGTSTLNGNTTITGLAKVSGNAEITGTLKLGTLTLNTDVDSNLGIGVADPKAKLDVLGTVKATSFEGDGSKLTGIKLRDTSVDGSLSVGKNLVVTGNLGVGGDPADNIRMHIRDGILRVSKGSRSVDIGRSDGDFCDFKTDCPRFYFNQGITIDSQDLTANKDGDELTALRIKPNFKLAGKDDVKQYGLIVEDGRVGIGTTSPDSMLDVEGEIRGNRLRVDGKTIIGGGTPDDDAKLWVNGKIFGQKIGGGSIEQVSSQTLKEEITDLSSQETTEILKALNPVKFRFKADDEHTLYAGFIAEKTPDLLTSADKQAVRVMDVVAILTKAVKDQRDAMATMAKVIKKQQTEITQLTEKMKALEKPISPPE